MQTRKFEVTQFFRLGLNADYFVESGTFTKQELAVIQLLRRRKKTKVPGSWHLTKTTL